MVAAMHPDNIAAASEKWHHLKLLRAVIAAQEKDSASLHVDMRFPQGKGGHSFPLGNDDKMTIAVLKAMEIDYVEKVRALGLEVV